MLVVKADRALVISKCVFASCASGGQLGCRRSLCMTIGIASRIRKWSKMQKVGYVISIVWFRVLVRKVVSDRQRGESVFSWRGKAQMALS